MVFFKQAVQNGAEILVPDLGSDKVWRLVKEAGAWVIKSFIQQPIGSGPRHIVLHGEYVPARLYSTCANRARSRWEYLHSARTEQHSYTTTATAARPIWICRVDRQYIHPPTRHSCRICSVLWCSRACHLPALPQLNPTLPIRFQPERQSLSLTPRPSRRHNRDICVVPEAAPCQASTHGAATDQGDDSWRRSRRRVHCCCWEGRGWGGSV